MPRHDFDTNDELVKARQRRDQQDGPRADGSGGDSTNLLSALGNARVQRLMRSAALQRSADGGGSVDDAVAQAIQSQRGSGQSLDEGARRNLEPAFGEDFSDVRVHTDSKADDLNHAVQAEAFTTGTDIFFREGSYSPGSSDGQKLLAHELTHVVQQRSAPPASELTVSDPEDASEREAGDVANSFSASEPTAAVSREEMPKEELAGSFINREGLEEEELPVAGQEGAAAETETASQEQMQEPQDEMGLPAEDQASSPSEKTSAPEEEIAPPMQEEEMIQGSFIDRAELPEEEELAGSFINRQAQDQREYA